MPTAAPLSIDGAISRDIAGPYGSFSNATGPFALLNGDDRGGVGPNGKRSLDPVEAGGQISRSNVGWFNGPLGTPGVVTFAFRSSAPGTMPDDTTGFSRFTEVQIAATLLALASWSDVANITFNRIQGGDGYSNNATMLFSNYSEGDDGAAAFAFLPGQRADSAMSGDVWIDSTLSYNVTPTMLAYGQQVLTHEIGHAIGLSHPAAYNASEGQTITYSQHATYYEDSRQYTVMSYFSESNTGGAFSGRYSAVPLLDDIAAAQRLYGANMTTRTGDTVYGFNATADRDWFKATTGTSQLIFAVWDAGGTDTFDFSGYLQAQTIDLRQGAFSSVGGLTGNVAVAIGAVIENAIGGSGADTIFGNGGDNTLTGGAGNDTIDGGFGVDTVVFSGVRSAYTITWNGQEGRVVGPDGTDTVINVEFLQFSDQRIAAAPTGGLNATGDITDNTVVGTAEVDVVFGLGGNDVISGLGGDDRLDGGTGDDRLSGGDGDDILTAGIGSDVLDGGAGIDMADFSTVGFAVSVNLTAGTGSGADGADTLNGIENVKGSALDDTLIGDAGANVLNGGGGADTIQGLGGDDTLIAGAGARSGGAPDIVKARSGANGSTGAAVSLDGGFDVVGRTDVANAETIPHATVRAVTHGGKEYYAFTATAGATVRIDIDLAAFDSVVRVLDAAGTEIGINDDANDDGGNRTDSGLTVTVSASGVFYVEVSEWADTEGDVVTTKAPDAGQAYTLHVSVTDHATVPFDLSGSTLSGGDGADVLQGNEGTDTLRGDAGDDRMTGGAGNDDLDGGAGTDTAVFSGLSTAAVFSYSDGAIVIHSVDGRDVLKNVERLQFSDRTLTVGSDGQVVIPGQGLNGTDVADVLNGTAGPDTINGLGGNDILNGLDGADILNGGDNQDILRGGAGSDRLDGGADYDRAMYSGGVRQYGVTGAVVAGGTFTTTVANGREGAQTDTLVSIEEAVFLDGSLSFDRNGVAAQVMRLYDAAFNRVPDQAGFEVLHADLATGRLTLLQLSTAFFNSAEFQATFGTLTNEQFVKQMYRFTLDREAEPAGLKVWVDALNGGMSRGQALLEFSESNEHRDLTAGTLSRGLFIPDAEALIIARLYDATYDRLPDVAGLEVWKNALESGMSLVEIARQFATAPEFQARYGALSDRAFVEQLYRFNLNREGDAAGIQNWVNALASGLSRAELLLSFSESAEHVALTRDLWLGGVRFQGLASPALDDKFIDALTLPALEDHGAKGGDPFVLPAVFDGLSHAASPTETPLDDLLTVSDLPWMRPHEPDHWLA